MLRASMRSQGHPLPNLILAKSSTCQERKVCGCLRSQILAIGCGITLRSSCAMKPSGHYNHQGVRFPGVHNVRRSLAGTNRLFCGVRRIKHQMSRKPRNLAGLRIQHVVVVGKHVHNTSRGWWKKFARSVAASYRLLNCLFPNSASPLLFNKQCHLELCFAPLGVIASPVP